MPTIAVNDIQLNYEIHGEGQPLILIAGLGTSLNVWRLMLPFLTPHFQVITFDNRGTGASSMPDLPYSVELFADDTLRLSAALNLNQPHVAGHSMGASIALQMGLTAPEKLGKVVLMSALYPGPTYTPPSARALEFFTARSGNARQLLERGLRISTAPGFEQRNPDLFQRLVDSGLKRLQPPAIYKRQLEAGYTYLQTDRLTNGFQPDVCLIYGAADEIAYPINGELIRDKLPTATYSIIPQTGHLLPEENPETVAKHIIAFLTA